MTVVDPPLIRLLAGPMGEDLDWRRFALPLLPHQFECGAAGLGPGLVWGVRGRRHLMPLFIDGSSQVPIPGSIPPASFLQSIVPALPTESTRRACALLLPMLVLLVILTPLASRLTVGGRAVGGLPGFVEAKP